MYNPRIKKYRYYLCYASLITVKFDWVLYVREDQGGVFGEEGEDPLPNGLTLPVILVVEKEVKIPC